MSQGLNVFLALTALRSIALLGVCLGYTAGGCEGALTLRQRNGDAECDGLLPVIHRRVWWGLDTRGQPRYSQRSRRTEARRVFCGGAQKRAEPM